MRVLILGATGKTGIHVVKQALAKGYIVTAYVRNAAKLEFSDKNVTVVEGDIKNSKSLAKAMIGQDAVVVALGAKKMNDTFMVTATHALIEVMKATGVKRIVMMSSFTAHPDFKVPFIMKVIWPMMKAVIEDKVRAEAQLKQTNLDWTIVYATTLTDGSHSGRYTVSETLPKKILSAGISRSNVADFMITCLENNKYVHKMPIISDEKL
jgi:uncharacterized protein YbjT (DUF2867 family)